MIEFTIAEGDHTEPTLPKGVGFAIWHNNFPRGFEDGQGVFDPDESSAMPDFIHVRKQLNEAANRGEEIAEMMSENDIDLLALAGVIKWDEVKTIIHDSDSGRQAIRRAMQKLYPEMTLSFSEDTLRINSIPTAIPVNSIKESYEGLLGLLDHNKAVEIIMGIMSQKLEPVFGKGKKVDNAESYS